MAWGHEFSDALVAEVRSNSGSRTLARSQDPERREEALAEILRYAHSLSVDSEDDTLAVLVEELFEELGLEL